MSDTTEPRGVTQPDAQLGSPALSRREPSPQDSGCPGGSSGHTSGTRDDTNPGHAVPFGQILNYGSDGSPTLTITKTLFTDAQITSTTSASQSSQETQDGTTTATTTGTSTVFNTVTVTSTSISTTTLSLLPKTTSSDVNSDSSKTTSAKPSSATATSSSTPGGMSPAHGGMIAGSVFGSMAAFSMIGFLIWYLLNKKGAGKRFKAKIKFRRRKSSDAKSPKTPQLECQSMEQTRAVMLQSQSERNKSKENDIDAFLATSAEHNRHTQHSLDREVSSENNAKARPSWIGVAVTSSTPPNTPPLPRSNSQKSKAPSTGGHPVSLMPGFGSQQRPPSSSSLTPAPLKATMKPAPILTTPHIARADRLSPLSPRAMLSAVGNGTSNAWRRASEALSPSAYQKIPAYGQSTFEDAKGRRGSTKGRNPEMEIGAQMPPNKGWI